jgi:hypothetical protein
MLNFYFYKKHLMQNILNLLKRAFHLLYLKIKNTVQENQNFQEVDFLHLGKVLYKADAAEFETYYTLYQTDETAFYEKYSDLLQSEDRNYIDNTIDDDEYDDEYYHSSYFVHFSLLEVVYSFGEYKQEALNVDWPGEENEGEIEEFVQSQCAQEIVWTNVNALRASAKPNRKGGFFALQLFKAIDKDLQIQGKNLLFFNLSWDAYALIPLESELCEEVVGIGASCFKGVDDL